MSAKIKKIFSLKNLILLLLISTFIFSSLIIFQYIYTGISNKKLNESILPTLSTKSDNHIEKSESDIINENIEIRKSSLSALKEANADIVGWIYVPNTNIDYPILKSTDNEFYLTRNFKKENSKYGSIFMDYRTSSEDENIILYGHHMKDGQMFSDLKKYKAEDFFNSNHPIVIILEDSHYYFEPISIYITDSNNNYLQNSFSSTEDYETYISQILSNSIVKNNFATEDFSKLITLSTCSYEFDNARLVLHGRLIN